MEREKHFKDWVPMRRPAVTPFGARRIGPPMPWSLVAPDLDRYEARFHCYKFREIAPLIEPVIVDRPKLDEQPKADLDELALLSREGCKKPLALWLCWFACQPVDRKVSLAEKARAFGGAYLSATSRNLADSLDGADIEPRISYQCGTMLMSISPEQRQIARDHWNAEEIDWIAWYARQGMFGSESTEAVAWNRAIDKLAAFGHTFPERSDFTRTLNYTVVVDKETQIRMSTEIDAAVKEDQDRRKREGRNRGLLLIRLSVPRFSKGPTGKRIPCYPMTLSEFEAKNKKRCLP